MLTRKCEIPAHEQTVSAAIARGDTTIQREQKNRAGIGRGERQIAGKARSQLLQTQFSELSAPHESVIENGGVNPIPCRPTEFRVRMFMRAFGIICGFWSR